MDYEEWAKDYEQAAEQLRQFIVRNQKLLKYSDLSSSCRELISAQIQQHRKLVKYCHVTANELRKRREIHEIH